MTAVWIVVAIIVALLLYLIVSYNKLVRLRNEVDQGFSSIDVQLKRRADLIPNLVESVKAYAPHEASVFQNVTEARAATLAATTLPAKAAADALMQSAITGLLGIAEAYPELRAVESFKALQAELSDTENKIAAARRYYNNTVRRYNTALQSVPDERDRRRHRLHAPRVLPHRGRRRPRAGRRQARPVTLQEQIRSNRIRTFVVLLGFAALVAALVAAIWFAYEPGVGGFVGVAAICYGLFAWFFADKMVAAASGAHPVTKEQAPELYRAVENAAIGAGMPEDARRST